MSEPLNKFEKEQRVIELHLEGKTIRAIAPVVHMSFGPISKIIKAYDKKIRLQVKKEEPNPSNQIKKVSKSSQAYQLLLDGRTPVQVGTDLDLDFPKIRKYWLEYLRLKNMTKLYNIYIQNEYHLDSLFKINYFLLRNEIEIKNFETILNVAYDITKLYQTRSNLIDEIARLKQTKNNISLNQNTNYQQQPIPLGPLPSYYNW